MRLFVSLLHDINNSHSPIRENQSLSFKDTINLTNKDNHIFFPIGENARYINAQTRYYLEQNNAIKCHASVCTLDEGIIKELLLDILKHKFEDFDFLIKARNDSVIIFRIFTKEGIFVKDITMQLEDISRMLITSKTPCYVMKCGKFTEPNGEKGIEYAANTILNDVRISISPTLFSFRDFSHLSYKKPKFYEVLKRDFSETVETARKINFLGEKVYFCFDVK